MSFGVDDVLYESDRDGIHFNITYHAPDNLGLLAPGVARSLLTELQRITHNASNRLAYSVHKAYPKLKDPVHRKTTTTIDGATAGLEILGTFFPLIEFDTQPHFPPSKGPTKKHPNRKPTRLWWWLQLQHGFPDPPLSAYKIAFNQAQGRSFNSIRHSRLSEGKSATFGAYAVTNAFVAESHRLALEYGPAFARALRGEMQ